MGKLAANILKISCWAFALWFFFAIFTPFLEDRIPAWKKFNKIQEDQNLDSGALYYTNVPQVQEAEENTRRAIKEGMQERRQTRRHRMEGAN